MYRSKQCAIVLPFIYLIKTCSKCSLLTAPTKIEKNDENVKHDIKLLPADHSDFVDILDKVISECPERLKVFLVSQKNAVTSCPNGRRWNKDVLRICLSLWCRSPRGYADLRSSGFVVLPSSRLLQYYKNSVNQVSGLNKEMLAWMQNEAKNKNLPPPEGYEGGILLDEMSIEGDIQFSRKGGGMKIVGLTDVTEESRYIQILKTHKNDVAIATHALQFLFWELQAFASPLLISQQQGLLHMNYT